MYICLKIINVFFGIHTLRYLQQTSLDVFLWKFFLTTCNNSAITDN